MFTLTARCDPSHCYDNRNRAFLKRDDHTITSAVHKALTQDPEKQNFLRRPEKEDGTWPNLFLR